MELNEWDLVVAEALHDMWQQRFTKGFTGIGRTPNRYIELVGVNAALVFYAKYRKASNGKINLFDIFKTKEDYINKEYEWYNSQSLDAKWIGQYAKTWLKCADENQKINSNYGYLLFSAQNGYQFANVLAELAKDETSRRAVAYYTNPFMHYIGGKDHICTLAVQYLLRNNILDCVVYMRSNDIVYGLIGADLWWQNEILNLLCDRLTVALTQMIYPGDIHWLPGSLHIYERHWAKLDDFIQKYLD